MDDQPRDGALRLLEPYWNNGLIAASIAVSLLGAFTSTQMMCQARTSRYGSGVLVWTILGSLTFGFCSIWCLHFIAMLACELDLPIGLNVPLTVLSAVLAVVFTFLALISDYLHSLVLKHMRKRGRKSKKDRRRDTATDTIGTLEDGHASTDALLATYDSEETVVDSPQKAANSLPRGRPTIHQARADVAPKMTLGPLEHHFMGPDDYAAVVEPHPTHSASPNRPGRWPFFQRNDSQRSQLTERTMDSYTDESIWDTESLGRSSFDGRGSRRSSNTTATTASDGSNLSLPGFMSFKVPKNKAEKTTNALTDMARLMYNGATLRNVFKGFIWSLAVTSMHYVGIFALRIPQGHVVLAPVRVILSAIISWIVCTVGCILIPQIEVNLSQQLVFSVIAAMGVAAMHFTGMWATAFYSYAEPTQHRGYPPKLAVAVTSIAILTCILANGLLAHSATVVRNKLAEVVSTKRKLWAAIAQKENAEAAAAARSEFIASASHEIRTPLHQLQGYSDLLARTQLTDDGRLLLMAIQQATRSLSMITANVLDWSRLEKGEAVCRPTSLDLRKACESILSILPNKDDEVEVELLVVIAPDVPNPLFLDETYLQRILMNLLSNALKFTQSGYVLLLVEMKAEDLVITVKDSGYGIPETFLPHLFEPFKQAQTRGAERGTGLGLAIIRQLLEKMQGSISVESNYQQMEAVGTERSGSTFTINIPFTTTPGLPQNHNALGTGRQIAVFEASPGRFFEGFQMAWEAYGFEVIPAEPEDEIAQSWDFVWVDAKFLPTQPKLLKRLMRPRQQLVLVSYDSQLMLDNAIGSVPPSHVVPIKRPYIWHRIVEIVAKAAESGKASVDRSVRFAPVVDMIEARGRGGAPVIETQALSGSTVLLVEDNKINQKLGLRMLKTLGYNAIVANDGVEAIEKVLEHDAEIDVILMDQSMPRKDGLSATRDIREMEAAGAVSRKTIIMVTAVVSSDAQAICMSAGADAFLAKPLALTKLEHTLKEYLE